MMVNNVATFIHAFMFLRQDLQQYSQSPFLIAYRRQPSRIWNYGYNTSVAWNLIDGITYLGVSIAPPPAGKDDLHLYFEIQMINLAGWIGRDRLHLVFYERIAFDRFLKPLLILGLCVAVVGGSFLKKR